MIVWAWAALAVVVWALAILLVVALCRMAARGDRQAQDALEMRRDERLP